MKTTIHFLFVLLCAGCASPLPEFTKLNRIDYSYIQRIKDPVSDLNQSVTLLILISRTSPPVMTFDSGPHQVFSTRGTNLVFASEQFRCELSKNELQELYISLRDGCLNHLPQTEKQGQTYFFGWFTLGADSLEDTREWYFRDTPHSKYRHDLHEQLIRFVEARIGEHPEGLGISYIHLQGDDQPAVEVALQELAQHPNVYDGRRVRVSGYHHAEFEHSSLSEDPAHINDYDHSIWLGGVSGTAKPTHVPHTNDAYVKVEGTFSGHRGGHLGLWPGEVDRLTKIEIQGEKQTIEPSVPPNTHSPSAQGVGGR